MPDFKDDMIRLQDELKVIKEKSSKLGREITGEQSHQLEQAISLTEKAIHGELNQVDWQKATGPLMLSLGKADVAFDQRNQRVVYQINVGNLTLTRPITPERTSLDNLGKYEAAFRSNVRKRFGQDAFYYINLSGETTELVGVKDDAQAPRSLRRRRQRMAAEYHKLNQAGREIVRVKLKTFFPDRELNIKKDGNVYKIYGDLSLGTM